MRGVARAHRDPLDLHDAELQILVADFRTERRAFEPVEADGDSTDEYIIDLLAGERRQDVHHVIELHLLILA